MPQGSAPRVPGPVGFGKLAKRNLSDAHHGHMERSSTQRTIDVPAEPPMQRAARRKDETVGLESRAAKVGMLMVPLEPVAEPDLGVFCLYPVMLAHCKVRSRIRKFTL